MAERVKVICYGKETEWQDRNSAIQFYNEGVAACEGSERERYLNIVMELKLGKSVARDINLEE